MNAVEEARKVALLATDLARAYQKDCDAYEAGRIKFSDFNPWQTVARAALATTTREDAPDAGGGVLRARVLELLGMWEAERDVEKCSRDGGFGAGRADAFAHVCMQLRSATGTGMFAATARPADTAVASPAPEAAITAAEKRVVEAARNLKFGAYPAHGSGYVAIPVEGEEEFYAAVRELEDPAPPASAPAADAEGGAS